MLPPEALHPKPNPVPPSSSEDGSSDDNGGDDDYSGESIAGGKEKDVPKEEANALRPTVPPKPGKPLVEFEQQKSSTPRSDVSAAADVEDAVRKQRSKPAIDREKPLGLLILLRHCIERNNGSATLSDLVQDVGPHFAGLKNRLGEPYRCTLAAAVRAVLNSYGVEEGGRFSIPTIAAPSAEEVMRVRAEAAWQVTYSRARTSVGIDEGNAWKGLSQRPAAAPAPTKKKDSSRRDNCTRFPFVRTIGFAR